MRKLNSLAHLVRVGGTTNSREFDEAIFHRTAFAMAAQRPVRPDINVPAVTVQAAIQPAGAQPGGAAQPAVAQPALAAQPVLAQVHVAARQVAAGNCCPARSGPTWRRCLSGGWSTRTRSGRSKCRGKHVCFYFFCSRGRHWLSSRHTLL